MQCRQPNWTSQISYEEIVCDVQTCVFAIVADCLYGPLAAAHAHIDDDACEFVYLLCFPMPHDIQRVKLDNLDAILAFELF